VALGPEGEIVHSGAIDSMKVTVRFGGPTAAAVAALAFCPVALAAYSPSLSITRNVNALTGDSTVDIAFSQPSADVPTARLQILSPFALEPGLWNVPGQRIGTVDGSVEGTITVEDQTRSEVKSAAQQCTGSDVHAAVWRLDRESRPLWIFVDGIAAMPFSDFAATSLQVCFPFGTKLSTATLHLGEVFQRFPEYRLLKFGSLWTAISTPYASDTSATVDELGAVETQSFDHWLVGTTFDATRVTKTRRVRHKRFTDVYYSYFARIRGSVSAGVGETAVTIFEGDRSAFDPPMLNGSFSTTLDLSKTTTYHAVLRRAPGVLEAWTCVPPLPAMRCGTITIGGFNATSWDERVVRPKLVHKRIPRGQG
jgi:hypothetical protein